MTAHAFRKARQVWASSAIIAIVLTPLLAYAAADPSILNDLKEIKQDISNVKTIQASLVNETHHKTLERLQVLFAFTTGIFALLGFKSWRDVENLKTTFKHNLHRLQDALDESLERQKETEMLRLENDAKYLVDDGDFQKALEVIGRNNESKNNLKLIHYSAIAYCNLHMYQEALERYKAVVSADPKPLYVMNLLEVALLSRDLQVFDHYLPIYDQSIKDSWPDLYEGLLAYFKAFRAYHACDINTLGAVLLEVKQKKATAMRWRFREAYHFLSVEKDSTLKTQMLKVIDYISNKPCRQR